MKKAKKVVSDPDMRAEYDFTAKKGGVRGKYAAAYRTGVNVVLLGPEVATALGSQPAAERSRRRRQRAR